VRLSQLAPDVDPLDLAAAKAAAECALAAASVGFLWAFTAFPDGRAFFASLPSADGATLSALGAAAVWCGAVTCARARVESNHFFGSFLERRLPSTRVGEAPSKEHRPAQAYTIWAQSFGQRGVSASRADIEVPGPLRFDHPRRASRGEREKCLIQK